MSEERLRCNAGGLGRIRDRRDDRSTAVGRAFRGSVPPLMVVVDVADGIGDAHHVLVPHVRPHR